MLQVSTYMNQKLKAFVTQNLDRNIFSQDDKDKVNRKLQNKFDATRRIEGRGWGNQKRIN